MARTILASENPSAVIASESQHTEYIISPGIYYDQRISLHAGKTLTFEDGAVFHGGQVLSGWAIGGNNVHYTTNGILSIIKTDTHNNEPVYQDGYERAGWNIALWRDGVPLRHKTELAGLASGEFFIDESYTPARIWIYDEDLPLAEYVISNREIAIEVKGDNATINGGEFRHYAPRWQVGVISCPNYRNLALNNVSVKNNYGKGGSFNEGLHMTDCEFSQNGIIGFTARGDGIVIDGLTMNDNNWARSQTNNEAGGCKISNSGGLTMRNVECHRNKGPGIWGDIDNYLATIEKFSCSGNERAGLYWEISQSATIQDGELWNNASDRRTYIADADIRIGNSENVTIRRCRIRSTQATGNQSGVNAGISLTQVARGSSARTGEERLTKNVLVEDCDIFYETNHSQAATGGFANYRQSEFWNQHNNRYNNVRFHLSGKADAASFPFVHLPNAGQNSVGSLKTVAQALAQGTWFSACTVDSLHPSDGWSSSNPIPITPEPEGGYWDHVLSFNPLIMGKHDSVVNNIAVDYSDNGYNGMYSSVANYISPTLGGRSSVRFLNDIGGVEWEDNGVENVFPADEITVLIWLNDANDVFNNGRTEVVFYVGNNDFSHRFEKQSNGTMRYRLVQSGNPTITRDENISFNGNTAIAYTVSDSAGRYRGYSDGIQLFEVGYSEVSYNKVPTRLHEANFNLTDSSVSSFAHMGIIIIGRELTPQEVADLSTWFEPSPSAEDKFVDIVPILEILNA